VFKSTDGAANWSAVNTNLLTGAGVTYYAIAIDPITPNTVYAGSDRGGVFKTTNGGGNWSAVNTGLSDTFIRSLAIDPVSPSTVYAGTGCEGVFKTTDGGANWSALTGLGTTCQNSITIDPLNPMTVYVATDGEGGIHQSTNGGANWTTFNNGLYHHGVKTIAVDPSTSNILYSGSYGGGVSKYEITSCPVTVAVADAAGGDSILGTLYRLRDEVMLPSADLKRYADLFYAHSLEATRIVLGNSELRSRVSSLLSRFHPVLKAAADRRPATLRASDVRDIDALIRAFSDKSGPALRADLERIRVELRNGSLSRKFGIRMVD
jgi:hypothetical protein